MMKTLSKRIDWQKTFGPKTFQPKGSQQTFFKKKDFQLNISQQVSLQPKNFWKKTQGKKIFLQNKTCVFIVLPKYSQKIFFLIFQSDVNPTQKFFEQQHAWAKKLQKNCFTVAKLFQSSPPPLHRDHKIKEHKNLKELCLEMEPPPP